MGTPASAPPKLLLEILAFKTKILGTVCRGGKSSYTFQHFLVTVMRPFQIRILYDFWAGVPRAFGSPLQNPYFLKNFPDFEDLPDLITRMILYNECYITEGSSLKFFRETTNGTTNKKFSLAREQKLLIFYRLNWMETFVNSNGKVKNNKENL